VQARAACLGGGVGGRAVDDVSSYVSKVSAALYQPTAWLGEFDSQMIWCNSHGLDRTETNRRT
jgi:hypothetical protein